MTEPSEDAAQERSERWSWFIEGLTYAVWVIVFLILFKEVFSAILGGF